MKMLNMRGAIAAFAMAWVGVSLGAALPEGYSEIPYLEGDGKAYIDTGHAPTPTMRFEALIDVKDISGDYFLFGASDILIKGGEKMQMWWETYNNAQQGGYVGSPGYTAGQGYYTKTSGSGISLSSAAYAPCRIEYGVGKYTITNTNTTEVNVYDGSAAFSSSIATTYSFTNTFYIFARNKSGANGIRSDMRVRSFKIYEGETLVRDLVPALRDKDSALGLYDLANDVFYVNANSQGTFTTEVTGNKKRLTYLGGTGLQYIETGYVFKKHPRVECCMCINTAADSDIMGTKNAQTGCFIVDYNDNIRTLYYRYGNSGSGSSMSTVYPAFIRQTWVEAVYDTTVTHDGVQIGTEVTKYDFSLNEQTFRIFQGRYNNMVVRYSYLRMYDDGVLVRDFIPAEVDGVVGFWDRLTQTLYTNQGTGSFEAGLAIPAKPGDFSILEIVGSPSNLGTVEPAYGQRASISGQSVTCTATAPAASDTERVTLTGWEVSWDGELQTSGTNSTATFTCGPETTTLKWLWGGEFYITFAAGAHGAITNSSGWYAAGETVSLLAVPDEGYEFIGWKNVPEGQEKLNPLPFVVDKARNIEAEFVSTSAQRLEYIGSTGLEQYIDTGYVFTNMPAVVARMMMMDTADKDFLGMPQAKADCFIVDYADGNGNLYYRYAAANFTGANYLGTSSSGKLIGKWFDCAWSNIVWHGGYKILDWSGNDYTGKFATNKQTFYLFGGRSFGKVRFGPVKMYDGATLVRDFIPAKLGGTAGMWDKVERKFYKNAKNTDAFEEGPIVATEPGDFAVTHKVTAGTGGTVAVSDANTALGDKITLTATPDDGYVFAGWLGNIPTAYVGDATASFFVTDPLVAQATFAQDRPIVVDPQGGGDYTSLEEAVAKMAGLSGTIKIKAGTYAITNTLAITGGLVLVPESGNRGDVAIVAQGDFTAVELSNPLARLSHLVISNGYTASATKGGNVTMSAGTIEDCLIVGGRMKGNAGVMPAAAGVYMTGGTLRDSTIRGNYTVGDNGYALGVYAKGADTLIENCDVSANTNIMNYRAEYLVRAGGVYLESGTLRNSYITNNVNNGHSALYVTGNGRVEDTLVADNVSDFYFDELAGGGYVPKDGRATFVRTTFARNSGFGVGGLYNGGTVALTDVKAYGNTAAHGSATDGNMDVSGCDVTKIDFTNPDEPTASRVADVYVPADTADLREAVRRCADGGTVHVAAGAYPIVREVVVDRPISIVGAGAETTSFYRDPSVVYTRLINLRHAEAVLEGVAVSNGQYLAANTVNIYRGTLRNAVIADAQHQSPCVVWNDGVVRDTRFTGIQSKSTYSKLGLAVAMMGSDVLVEDCLFEKNGVWGTATDDNLVNLKAGRLARCVFRDNFVCGQNFACVGLLGAGVAESLLIERNNGAWWSAAGFIVEGSGWQVRNCTVVSNLSEYAGAGVYWETNANAKAVRTGSFVNCIFYRNHCTKEKVPENFDISAGNGTHNIDVTFTNCLFTTAEAVAVQGERAVGALSGDPMFRSLANRNFSLVGGSPAQDAGVVWEGAEAKRDLRGKPLTKNGLIDIGCMATGKEGTTILLR